ncbi:PEP phosphonomutase-like protein [Stemphylium lycopersici]|uniref:PEP phosphonomutase-like protein n=1 Tax=Stemphylium lycopersici TaxID=183478 RepID=A0A364N5D2_STELY|nr:PEP phosphonomutase-like protein [Stemphylium lycopersici]
MSSSPLNALAQRLKALHAPGKPLVLTNVWDAISASAIASLPSTKALATASAAISAASGLSDDDLTLDVNLRAVETIARVAAANNLPLTVDLQDGFGDQLEEAVKRVIALGATGINLEDYGREIDGLYGIDEQCDRISRTMAVASEKGVTDFVINARTDALFAGTGVEDAIKRGKRYLDAGAWNVFVWGGPSRKGWGRDEVEKVCRALDGRLNVILVTMREDGLTIKELEDIGVARISVGPQLMYQSKTLLAGEAQKILDGRSSAIEL